MMRFTLAGGCFWCLDAVFRRLKGVESSRCGYAGGGADDAHYARVATGKTHHAEAVQVIFDEMQLPADTLLDLFFLIHDPTTPHQQGADIGPQYRSAMFYENADQKSQFEAAAQRAQEHWNQPIVTELSPLEKFYEAEAEHQDYFTHNPQNPYCSVVINPKIIKARNAFNHYIKDIS